LGRGERGPGSGGDHISGLLKRQPASFQDEVLGKTKAKLFREGGLNVDQFVDRAGNELTLSQLAERKPDAFRKAGLDPEKF